MNKKMTAMAVLISLGLSMQSFAQNNYELGTTLTPTQISSLGALQSFNVGSKAFRVLPGGTSASTYIINDQGKIGKCDGDVLISGVSTDQAKKALEAYQSSVVSIKVYDSLKMVSAKFSNVQEAAKARNELATNLLGASVTLPITFTLPKSQ